VDRLTRCRRRPGGALLGLALGVLVAFAAAGCTGVKGVLEDIGGAERAPEEPERAQEAPEAQDRAARLREVCDWAPIFGDADPAGAGTFDVVVVDAVAQPNGYSATSPATLRALQGEGALVLAYLSVGTVEEWRHYAQRVPGTWTLGPVDGWAGERYVDARNQGWRALMAREARTLAAAGFDGLYLDNLDVAELHPRTADGVVTLVEGLAEAAPDLLLVAQNGLAVADRLPIDGLAHEDVFWRWDGGYRRSTEAERAEVLPRLRALHERGLPIFTLDYARPGSEGAREALTASLAEGFRPAVSVLDLDRLPHGIPAC
jgi:uncharacterized protein (TIGR01370 family)